MSLGHAPAQYSATDQNRTRAAIDAELDKRVLKGGLVEIAGGRLVLTDPGTGLRYDITVPGGVLTATLSVI